MDDRMQAGQARGHDVTGDELLPDPPVAARTRRPAEPEPAIAAPVVERRRTRLRAPLLIGGLVLFVVLGLVFYLRGGRYEATDDAALQAGTLSVAANVGGPVVAIAVTENQPVRAGQLLFRIDPRPYQAAVDEAAARLADARAQVASSRASYRRGTAEIAAARARLTYAVAEAARQKQLLGEGISSQNQYDQAVLAVATERQAVETSAEQAASVRATIGGDAATPTERLPAVQAAQAALDRARLNLGYTAVRAPEDGIVTRVNQLQLGSYVSIARPVFSLVGRRLWIEANYKEDQLQHVRVGQPATVRIDAYPGRVLRAHVASFSPGTGNSFALLPAENATGNWVKVIQRLPIEVELDERPADLPLHAGLSARVTIDTGHVRHLLAGAR